MTATLPPPTRARARSPAAPAGRRDGYVPAEDYLRLEEAAATKHEWYDGEVREMAGVSAEHSLIANRIRALLDAAYAGPRWLVFDCDFKTRIPGGPYVYPDAAVAAIPARFEPPVRPGGPRTVLLTPAVIVEVLSDSTEETDRGEKLDGYRAIPTLTDYLLFSQDGPTVEHHRRAPGGEWARETHRGRGAAATLAAGGAVLNLGEIYEVLDGLAA